MVFALVAFAGLSSAAQADEGYVQLTIYKGGWIIGGNGGGGVLDFHGRRYSLGIGGIDYGLVFGGSRAVLRGRVHTSSAPRISRASMRRGARALWSAAASAASCSPTRGASCSNCQAAQVGLMANADLSGLAISIR